MAEHDSKDQAFTRSSLRGAVEDIFPEDGDRIENTGVLFNISKKISHYEGEDMWEVSKLAVEKATEYHDRKLAHLTPMESEVDSDIEGCRSIVEAIVPRVTEELCSIERGERSPKPEDISSIISIMLHYKSSGISRDVGAYLDGNEGKADEILARFLVPNLDFYKDNVEIPIQCVVENYGLGFETEEDLYQILSNIDTTNEKNAKIFESFIRGLFEKKGLDRNKIREGILQNLPQMESFAKHTEFAQQIGREVFGELIENQEMDRSKEAFLKNYVSELHNYIREYPDEDWEGIMEMFLRNGALRFSANFSGLKDWERIPNIETSIKMMRNEYHKKQRHSKWKGLKE